jgi:hypothetical protein
VCGVGNSQQTLDKDDREIADIGRRLSVHLPGAAERVAHGPHRRVGQFGKAFSCGCHQRAGSLDDVLAWRRDPAGGEQGDEVAHREGTFAWRLRVDDRLVDVRRLEPQQEVDVLKRCLVELARPVVRERDPARQCELDRLRKWRRVLAGEGSIRIGGDRKAERQSVDERFGQRAPKAIARADERDRERVHGRSP